MQGSSPIADSLYGLYNIGVNYIAQHYPSYFYLLESSFYNRVKAATESSGDLIYLVNSLASTHFTLSQASFCMINLLLTIRPIHQIAMLSKDYSFVQAASQTQMGMFLPTAILGLALLGTSATLFSHLTASQTSEKSITQILSGTLQITNIVNSLALAALDDKPVRFLINGALNAYSLFKNHQINWVNVKQSCIFERERFKQMDFSYSAMLIEKNPEQDQCAFCHKEGPDGTFCDNGHSVHSQCLESHIQSKAETFFDQGIYRRQGRQFVLDVPNENLPSCPTCKQHSNRYHLSVALHDREKEKKRWAQINVTPDHTSSYQKGFEKANAIYTTFQAGLALLQQIPEFAPGITTLRHYLMVTDILSGMMTTYYLRKNSRQDPWFPLLTPALATIPAFLGIHSLFAGILHSPICQKAFRQHGKFPLS